jgi:hypothetical protein
MEQVRRRIKMELVSRDDRVQKLINLTTFKHATSFNENLSAISLENKIEKFDKPIYKGIYHNHVYSYFLNYIMFFLHRTSARH